MAAKFQTDFPLADSKDFHIGKLSKKYLKLQNTLAWINGETTGNSKMKILYQYVHKKLKQGVGAVQDNLPGQLAFPSALNKPKGPKEKFIECCKEIEVEIKAVNDQFGVCVSTSDLDETRSQLEQSEVLISFYGQYSAGKSTLLNIILQKELLPMKKKAETSFQLKIQPMTDPSEWGITSDEVLLMGSNDEIIATEVAGVYKKLEDINRNIRMKQKVNSTLTLKVCSSLLDGVARDWVFSITDNPGFNESSEHITDIASWSLKHSTACVFVTTYDHYEQKDAAAFFKAMYMKNKNVFTESRVIIVVNKLDQALSPGLEDDALSTDDIINDVRKHIVEVCKCSSDAEVPKSIVLPVCGLWAQKARLLIEDLTSSEKREVVCRYLNNITFEPCGEGDRFGERKSSEELASKLLDLSNIAKLEIRLKEVAHVCVNTWQEKIKGDYKMYLERCIECVVTTNYHINEEIRGISNDAEKHLDILLDIFSTFENILQTITEKEKSEIWKELIKSCHSDMNKEERIEVYGMNHLSQLLTSFRAKVLSKIGEGSYGPNEFVGDMYAIVQETRENFQAILNEQCSFQMLYSCRQHFLEKIISDVAGMAKCVVVLSPDSKCHYDEMTSKESTDKYQVLELPDFNDAAINAPEVNRTFLQKFVDYVQTFMDKLAQPGRAIISSIVGKSDKDDNVNTEEDGNLSKEGDDSANTGEREEVTRNERDDTEKRNERKYNKWQPEMDTALETLSESIRSEIHQLLADKHFRGEVVKKYWESYCSLAQNKLHSFMDFFSEDLAKHLDFLYGTLNRITKKYEKYDNNVRLLDILREKTEELCSITTHDSYTVIA